MAIDPDAVRQLIRDAAATTDQLEQSVDDGEISDRLATLIGLRVQEVATYLDLIVDQVDQYVEGEVVDVP